MKNAKPKFGVERTVIEGWNGYRPIVVEGERSVGVHRRFRWMKNGWPKFEYAI